MCRRLVKNKPISTIKVSTAGISDSIEGMLLSNKLNGAFTKFSMDATNALNIATDAKQTWKTPDRHKILLKCK